MVLTGPRGGAGIAGASGAAPGSGVAPAPAGVPSAGDSGPSPAGAAGGTGDAPAGTARSRPDLRRAAPTQEGSQSLEVALALPLAVILCLLVVHAGIAGMDLVVAQSLAREAARMAAVDDDATVRAHLAEAAGRRPVDLDLRPPSSQRSRGETVTAQLRIRSQAFAAFGVDVWLPAQATMRVEDP